MRLSKTPLNIAMTIGLSTVLLSACGSSSNNSDTGTGTSSGGGSSTGGSSTGGSSTGGGTTSRFSVAVASAGNGGGEMLIDTTTNLTWVNDTNLDTNRDGCVSPGAVGPTEPVAANSRCVDQTYGGFNDWRAPTTAELSTFIQAAVASNTTMKYLIAACPALVGTDGIVRTENDGNPQVATEFPNSSAGDVLGTVLADLNGVPAGVRCVRNGIDAAPMQTRFTFARADVANLEGRTLIDTQRNLEWINQTNLDANGDGCVSPGAVGPTSPDATADASAEPSATSRCEGQTFAGHDDWRAPTGAELSDIIKASSTTNGVVLKYLIAGCPANVSTENFIRTENDGNPQVSMVFPNSETGDILATLQADMQGVPSGVRCVRNITP